MPPTFIFSAFLSTLSLRRATASKRATPARHPYFYPRSPCGERLTYQTLAHGTYGFLSTLSLRRATLPPDPLALAILNFYPRSPCGERPPDIVCRRQIVQDISIHALLAESDEVIIVAAAHSEVISIHALLAESDSLARRSKRSPKYFYPRSPCGERPVKGICFNAKIPISIHALLAESDHQRLICAFLRFSFLSTLSLRRATQAQSLYLAVPGISIHALLAESDAAMGRHGQQTA